MNDLFVQTEHTPKMSDGLIEATWKTLIALAAAAAICNSIISLSAHLDGARIARTSVDVAQAAAATTPSGLRGLAPQ
jgi:hypothetical protein